MATVQLIHETQTSLERIQSFDSKSLARVADLGRQLSFEDAVAPAQRLIELYKRVPVSILTELVDSQLQVIKQNCDAEFNRFNQILNFSADQNNAAGTRNALISQIVSAYDNAFQALWQYIAYGVASVTDTSLLENRARSVLQSIEDRAGEIAKQMEDKEKEAELILKNIQAVAAEQGVSQQAEFFKRRADEHEAQVKWWRNRTAVAIGATLFFAFLSAVAYKIPWLKPGDQFDVIEFISGKILVFITLAAVVALCARNFLAHQHNVILNRHR